MEQHTHTEDCERCDGEGCITITVDTAYNIDQEREVHCPDCDGTGKL